MKDKIVSKLKSYGFWMSLVSAVFVFLNTLGMKMDIPYLTQITTAFLGILAVAGIISRPSGGDGGDDSVTGAISSAQARVSPIPRLTQSLMTADSRN